MHAEPLGHAANQSGPAADAGALPDGPERRTDIRTTTRVSTVIFYDQRNRSVGCAIRNISAGGARVELSEPAELTEAIQIRLSSGVIMNALVRWRIGLQAGLEFIG